MALPLRESRKSRREFVTPPRARQRRMTGHAPVRIPNYRLIGITLVAILVLAPAIYLWHGYQVSSQATVFLDAATRAEGEEDWHSAEKYLQSYQSLVPNDPAVLGRLAEAIDKGGVSIDEKLSAVSYYSQALGLSPERNDLRVRLAQLQLLSNRETALKTAEKALEIEPGDRDALAVRAVALYQGLEPDRSTPREAQEAAGALRLAFEKDPKSIDIAVMLATVYRKFAGPLSTIERVPSEQLEQRANALMDEMVTRNAEQAKAYMTRYQYRIAMGEAADSSAVDADVRRAMQIDPTDPNVRLAAARHVLDQATSDPLVIQQASKVDSARLDEAIGHFRLALNGLRNDPRPYVGLAYAEIVRGRHEDAIRILQDGLVNVDRLHPLLNTWLAHLLMHQRQWAEAALALEALDRSVNRLRSRGERPEERKRFELIAKLLRANWYLAEGNPEHSFLHAARYLREVNRLNANLGQHSGTSFRLAQAYAAMGQFDSAARNFEMAAARGGGKNIIASIGYADSLRRCGRFREAAEVYSAVMNAEPAGIAGQDLSDLWVDVARARMGELLTQAEATRNWGAFDAALAAARKPAPESLLPVALEIEAAFLRGEPDAEEKILSLLEREAESRAARPDFLELAADTYLRLAQCDRAEEAVTRLEQVRQVPEERRRSRLRQARIVPAIARRLHSDVESFLVGPPRFKPIAPPIETEWVAQEGVDARADLAERARRNPVDLMARWRLGLIAASEGNQAETRQWREALEPIEGPEGTYWRYLLLQEYLLQARDGASSALDQAAETCRQILQRRPEWSLARVAEGIVAESRGSIAEAQTAYSRALELGDRDPLTTRRLLGLWLAQGMKEVAWRHLANLPRSLWLRPDFSPIVARLALDQGQSETALALAEEAARIRPDSAEALADLVRVRLLVKGDDRETLESLTRRVARQAPADLHANFAVLLTYLAGDFPGASNKILAATRHVRQLLEATEETISPEQLALMVASGQHWLGDFRAAELYWRDGTAGLAGKSPTMPPPLPLGALMTLERTDFSTRIWSTVLRELPQPPRAALGLILGSSGASPYQELAAELLGDEPRIQAIALVARGGPVHRRKALSLLEQIPRAEWTASDHRFVGHVLTMDGNHAGAIEHFRAAAQSDSDDALLLQWANAAARAGQWDEADSALAGIAQPDQAEVVELRVLLFAARQRPEAAINAARDYVEGAIARSVPVDTLVDRGRSAIGWLVAAGLLEPAAALARSLAERDREFIEVLAECLARDPKTLPEAVDLCLREADRDPGIRPARLAARVLTFGAPDEQRRAACEKLLERVPSDGGPEADAFRTSLAVLREFQGKPDDAVRLTRSALGEREGNPAHLNNLAWFLAAYRGEQGPALEAARRVILTIGPVDAALDTLGVAYTESRQTDAAIRVLEHCIAVNPRVASYHLHLADAYAAEGHLADSARAVNEAKALGLEPLNPRDRQVFERLRSDSAAAAK